MTDFRDRLRRVALAGVLPVVVLSCGSAGAADAVPGEQWCDVPGGDGIVREIGRIEFAGNRVTRPEVMLREIPQRVGEPCSLDDIIDGVQGMADLGLFRTVRAEIELAGDGGLVLRYRVREKLFFLAIPRLSRTSDGELRTGLQLRWDNFGGRLHELRATAERRQENDGAGRAGYVYSIDYEVPRFLGSVWGAGLSLSAERRQAGFARESREFGEGMRESLAASVGVSRWIGPYDGIRGLRGYVGVGFEERELEVHEGHAGPYRGGTDLSLSVGVENRELHRDPYRRRGHVAGLRLGLAGGWTGSDFEHHRLDLDVRWYHPLEGGIRNLNLRVRLGLSDGAAFGDEAYSIGGGELLRGVASGRDSGDLLTLLNVEYLAAFFTRPQWRWVAFADLGNVHRRGRLRLFAQNLSGGLGLRYKLRALTRTDLRLDVAWDPDERRAVPYVATSVTF